MTAPSIQAGYTSGADSANTTTTHVTAPTNAAGDVIYIAIVSDAASQTFTAPTGFSTLYSNVAIPSTSPTATFAVFYKTSTGSEAGPFDVGLGTSERQSWVAWAVHNDYGIDVSGTTNTGSSGTGASVNFITTDQDDCLVIGVIATDGATTPHTPASMTKLTESAGSSAGSVSVHYEAATTLGTWPSNSGVTINTSEQWAGVAFAIKGPPAGRTGTLSTTLGTLTTTAAGVIPIVGTSAVTLDALTVSGAGNVPRTGSGAITLDVLTVSATGTGASTRTGTADITLSDATLSGAGLVPRTGSADITLVDVTTTTAGAVAIKGIGAVQLSSTTLDAAGTVPVVVTPPSIRGYAKGADTGNTNLALVVLPPDQFDDGNTIWIAIVSDAGSQVFTPPAGFTTLYNNVAVSGSTATLGVFYKRNILKADEGFDGTDYDFFVGTATAERQSWIIFATTGDGTIDVQGINATGSSTAASIPTLTTTANADLVIGIVATDGTTTPHNNSGAYTKLNESSGNSAGSISVWQQTKSTAGPVAADTVSMLTEQWVGVSFALAPGLGGRANITLGDATLSATGIQAVRGTAAITLDAVTISASSGTVPRTGSAAITLDPVTVTSLPPRTGSLSATLGAATVAATGSGTAPITGSAAITLGDVNTSATGSLGVDLPAPTIRSYSSGYDASNTTTTTVVLPDFENGDTLYIALVSDRTAQTFNAPTPYFAPSKPFSALYNNVAIPTASPTATFAVFYLQNAQIADFDFDGTNYTISVPVVIPERQSYIAIAVTSDGGTDEQGANQTGNSATATIPAITTTHNNSLIIGIVATDGDSTPHTGASGYTQLTEVDGPSAGSMSLWTHVLGTAGAYGADSVSITSEQWLGVSFSIPPTLPGRVAVTLGELTTSAAGVVPVKGAADITLGEITTTSSGTVPRTGSADITLGALTVTSLPPRTGILAKTLGTLTTSATGIVLSGRVGNANITLGGLTVSGSGQTTVPRPAGITNVEAQSPLATIFTISVENATGAKLGGGPIVTGTRWTYKQKLSAAGEWELQVPVAEPRLSVATLKRRVHCYVRRSGRLVWLGGGIIESRQYGLSGDNVPVMTLSGPDLLRELAGVTVAFEVNALDAAPRAITILNDLFAAVPSWIKTLPDTLPEITARFVHESVLNGLVATCEKLGAFFWMEPYVTRPRSIVIATAPVASSIIATNMADPLAAERNLNLCLISDIERTETSWDAYNRLIVYGAGDGQARLTLAAATQWPNGSSVSASYLFTDPYGRSHEFVLDKITNTITDALAVAEYGQIEQAAAFKDIAPITPNDADMQAAANTLVVAAVNQLVLSSFPTESYRLSVAALRAVVHPGMQIRVVARKYRDGLPYIEIDERLIIQEVDYEIDETGEKVTGLVVATTWKAEKTGATILSEQIQKLTALEAHPQMGANENTISYREDVDDDYGASFPFWLSRGTVTVNSIILRYKLEKLRSSVKSVGGTATGSATLPQHTHGVNTPNHSHNVPITGAGSPTGSHPFATVVYYDATDRNLYFTAGDGAAFAITSVVEGGASVTSANSAADIPISINIANAISAQYGVFVDPNPFYGRDDLALTVNRQAVTETPVNIGGDWNEIDITRYLINTITLRPSAYDNVIEVAVKTANKAGKKVRVTAQVEIRTTIQTIQSLGAATEATGGIRP